MFNCDVDYKQTQLAGVVLHYFIVNISLWWFFHVCSMFYKVTFPFFAKRWEKHNKYLHLASFILGQSTKLDKSLPPSFPLYLSHSFSLLPGLPPSHPHRFLHSSLFFSYTHTHTCTYSNYAVAILKTIIVTVCVCVCVPQEFSFQFQL